MKRFLVFSLAGVLLLAGLWYADTRFVAPPPVVGTAAALPTRTPEPTPTQPARTGNRAVVISLAGAQAARTRDYMADGTMPNLARLEREGAMAQYALSVDPSLTAAAHASLATGVYPADTGVVSDRYHRLHDELPGYVDALEQPQMGAELVWRMTMREARRTAAVCWPGTSLDAPETLADYTVTHGVTDAGPAQHEVSLALARSWAGAPPSFSPLREGSLSVRKDGVALVAVHVLAVDTTDDDQANYDTFVLSRERRVDESSAHLRLGETAPLLIDERLVSGAHFTLAAAGEERLTLFQSRVCYNRAQPNELLREVNSRFGFYPPGPDDEALEQGWITPAQYVEAAEAQSRWVAAVTRHVLEAYKPEVLFAWQGPAAALQRQFLLVDPGQPRYTPELAAEYDGYVRRGYALADAAVGELAGAMDLEQATLLVVSDQGLAPVHSQVYVNTVLSAHRLLACDSGPGLPVSVARSKALAFASGGASHVYINLQGRERRGIVPEDEYGMVQDAIVAAFERVQDPEGRPVFDAVLRRGELGKLELNSPTAGDVFLQAAPGYALSDRRGQPNVVGPVAYCGERGYGSGLPEMQAIFLAVGRGIEAGAEVGPVHIVDLAPTVYRLLDVKPPEPLAGRVLEEILLP